MENCLNEGVSTDSPIQFWLKDLEISNCGSTKKTFSSGYGLFENSLYD